MKESVSVIGTTAFMEFVESIQAEGVELERQAMGVGTGPITPLVIEVDKDNPDKDIDALDISIPRLTGRVYREYKNLADLDVTRFDFPPVTYREFSEAEQREIVFKDMTTGETAHTTRMDSAGVADYRSVIGYFGQTLMKELRLVGGYDALYPKVQSFIENHLFGRPVALENPNTLRNLSEVAASKTVFDTFKRAINALTVQDKGDAQISDTIKLRSTRPFVVKDQPYVISKKSVFNKITGDNKLERDFAAFLENCPDVLSYAKNYLAVNFKLDYVKADGDIANYYPDFIVKLVDGNIVIAETKGREDTDVAPKMQRLAQWCIDVNRIHTEASFDFVYVDEDSFHAYRPSTFRQLLEGFTEYKCRD